MVSDETPVAVRTCRHLLEFDPRNVDWIHPSNRNRYCAIFMNKVFHTFDTKAAMRTFCQQSSLLFTEYSPPVVTPARGAGTGRAG